MSCKDVSMGEVRFRESTYVGPCDEVISSLAEATNDRVVHNLFWKVEVVGVYDEQ